MQFVPPLNTSTQPLDKWFAKPPKVKPKKSGFSILLIHLFSNLIGHFIACPVHHVLKLSNICYWKFWGPDFYIVDGPLGIFTLSFAPFVDNSRQSQFINLAQIYKVLKSPKNGLQTRLRLQTS